MPYPEPPAAALSPTAARIARIAGLALALAILAMASIAGGASASGTIARRGSCPAGEKHARHAVRASHCVKRTVRRARPVSRQHSRPVRKGAHHPTAAVPTPALCEDASAPVRAGGEFACQDGSEPGCEDGSEPTASSAGGVPLCPAAQGPPPGPPAEPCEAEGAAECQLPEWSCEGSIGSNEAPAPCERSGGGEAAS